MHCPHCRSDQVVKNGKYHAYVHRKVWREGLEVAMKVKGSQGNRRIVSVKPTEIQGVHIKSPEFIDGDPPNP